MQSLGRELTRFDTPYTPLLALCSTTRKTLLNKRSSIIVLFANYNLLSSKPTTQFGHIYYSLMFPGRSAPKTTWGKLCWGHSGSTCIKHFTQAASSLLIGEKKNRVYSAMLITSLQTLGHPVILDSTTQHHKNLVLHHFSFFLDARK